MPVLIDVMHNNMNGLVGLTETGEEILLSVPHPVALAEPKKRGDGTALRRRLINTARADSNKFYQINKEVDDTGSGAIAIAYNVYTRR